MAFGGRVGFEAVAWFNGGLFDDADALPLERSDVETVLAASALDWSEVDPSILGTLFERGLDPDKRAQLGAHYTDRDKIMLLVEPVVIRPLLAEWAAEKTEIAAELERAEAAKASATRTKRRREAERRYRAFLNRLRGFTVLDPACGSGNFLHLALQALKDLEHRVQLEAEADLGFQRAFPEVGPANVKGIEINPYAAELARVSVWIGEIQWMRRNGFAEARDPVLKPLDTIECRDAILTADSTEPAWPAADVVIGNPPFLGGKLLITHLGEEYVSRMFATYDGRVPAEADLVCYWFEKAGQQIASGKAARAGLVATNSIRGGANRRALQAATATRRIFEAWSDEPWVIDGAAVRVSLVCFSRDGDESVSGAQLDGQPVDEIYSDLTPRRGGAGVDLTEARRLPENADVAFMGDTKGGPFDVSVDRQVRGQDERVAVALLPEAVDDRRHQPQHAAGPLERHQRRPVRVQAVEDLRMDRVCGRDPLLVVGVAAFRRELLVLTAVAVGERARDDVAVLEPRRVATDAPARRLAFSVPWHRDRGGNPRDHTVACSNLVEALKPPHSKPTFSPCLLGDLSIRSRASETMVSYRSTNSANFPRSWLYDCSHFSIPRGSTAVMNRATWNTFIPSKNGATSRFGSVMRGRSLSVRPERTFRESRFVMCINEFLSSHNSSEVTPTAPRSQYSSSQLVKQLQPSGPYSMNPKVSMVENTSFRHDTYFRLFHRRWIATK